MRIGLDLSGVIANHLADKAAFARTACGIHVTEREATRELMLARLGEEGYKVFAKAFSSRSFESRLALPLYHGVRENLMVLHAEGARFVLVSKRSTMALEPFVRAYVYERHQLPIENVIVVTDDQEKVEACHRAGITAFFDDNRSVLERLLPLRITLAWANFYGIQDVDEHRFSIAHSWDEFATIVRAL